MLGTWCQAGIRLAIGVCTLCLLTLRNIYNDVNTKSYQTSTISKTASGRVKLVKIAAKLEAYYFSK